MNPSSTAAKQKQRQLLQLQQTLPPGLPEPPSWLVQLARSVKKLEDLRQMKFKRDSNGQKIINNSNNPSNDSQKKYQGVVLQNYKNALIQVDKIHMKGIIELKAVQGKIERLEKFQQSSNVRTH